MFTFFVFFATIILTVKAGEYVIEVTKTNIIQTPYTENYIKVKNSKKTSELTWIVDVDDETNPIKVQLQLLQNIEDQNVLREIMIENLCDEYDDQEKQIIQEIVLQKFAGTDSCPIKMDSNAVIKYQTSIPFSKDFAICGSFSSRIQMFISTALILQGAFKGNVTGSSCQ